MELPALTIAEWVLAMLCGLLIGISKTGISGAGIAVVPIFALTQLEHFAPKNIEK